MVKVTLETSEAKSTEPKELPRKKRYLFRKLFLLLLLAIVTVGLLLPQILSNASIRKQIASVLMKDFQGQIDIESADLAWWKPIEISSLTMLDDQGIEIAKIDSAKISTPLWRMFWPGDKPLVLEVSKPQINLVISKYGTNWQYLFSRQEDEQDKEFTWPELRHNSKPIQIKIIDGQVKVIDLVSKRTVELRNLDMYLEKSSAFVSGNLTGDTLIILDTDSTLPAGNVRASFQITLAKKKAVGGEVKGELKNIPLELIQPWLKKMLPHLHLSAQTIDATFDSKWTGNIKSGLKLALSGEVNARKVDIQSTEWLQENQLIAEILSATFRIDNTLPNIPGDFALDLKLNQCKIDPTEESVKKMRKTAVSSVDLGTFLIQSSGTIDSVKQQIALQKCKLECKPCRLAIEGSIEHFGTVPVLDLKGTGEGDIIPLLEIAIPDLQQTLQIKRLSPEEFAIRGAVPAFDKKVIVNKENAKAAGASNEKQPSLSAVSKWTWDTIEAYGVVSHQGQLWTKYENEQLRIVPIKIPIGKEGEFVAKSVLDFRNGQQTLRVEAGPVLKNVEFSNSMTRSWLKYVSPIFADATDVDGVFSLEVAAAEIDMSTGEPKQLQGTLEIHSCKLGPGPTIRKATAPIAGLRTLINPESTTPQLLASGSKWLQLPRQKVQFMLKEDRVYHDHLVFQAGKVQIVSSGSVGLDQTLDTSIKIPLDFIKGTEKPLLALLKQQEIEVHIRGTLSKPQVDASKMKDLSKQVAPAAINSLIQGLFDRRRKKKNSPSE